MFRLTYAMAIAWIIALIDPCVAEDTPYLPLTVGEMGFGSTAVDPRLAEYFRSHARIRLGAEKRLPNGVSWRFLIDEATGIRLPRLTWMSDRRSAQEANRLLEMLHGRSVEYAQEKEEFLRDINAGRKEMGLFPLEYQHAVHQTDSGITYAGEHLISLVDLGYVESEGTGVERFMRGTVLDLRQATMASIEPCGAGADPFGFHLGDFLDVCSPARYDAFVSLLQAKAEQAAHETSDSSDPSVIECSEKAGPFVERKQPVSLYLTFTGLAVHNTEFWPDASRKNCSLVRSPVNPVIVPYRELEPFIKPGPWRDELLGKKS